MCGYEFMPTDYCYTRRNESTLEIASCVKDSDCSFSDLNDDCLEAISGWLVVNENIFCIQFSTCKAAISPLVLELKWKVPLF